MVVVLRGETFRARSTKGQTRRGAGASLPKREAGTRSKDMINTHLRKRNKVPWWAVIGAPVVGVPCIVALLALAGPEQEAGGADTEVDFAVEQLDVEPAEARLEARSIGPIRLVASC